MAFGKYTNDYNVRSKASSLSSTDEGLRKFMLKVYGYMSAGLGITGVIAWLFAIENPTFSVFSMSLTQGNLVFTISVVPSTEILSTTHTSITSFLPETSE